MIDNPSVTKNALYMAGTGCHGPINLEQTIMFCAFSKITKLIIRL